MKTACMLLLLIGFTFGAKASGQRKSVPGFYIFKTTKNTTIRNGEAKLNLHFNCPNFSAIPSGYEIIIYYAVNQFTDTLVPDSLFSATIQLPAGKTVFKFWPGPGYNEVISDTVLIENQTDHEAMVNFYSENMLIEVDKPVIYLQSPYQLDFSIRVTPTNGFSFTYPPCSDPWKGTLYPTGKLEINGQMYPYLFWDAKQEFSWEKHANGYHISRKEVVPFLEKQLACAGLTATEKTDFITYWGPRLARYEEVFIRFYTQEDCNQFATIQCNPQPSTINRLYMAFSEWNEQLNKYLLPVDLPAFKREGFHVLEWGGFELKPVVL